jgi:hypothetical protein
MSDIVNEYRKLINKHYSAVQTDTAIEYTDSFSIEKKALKFMEIIPELERAFIARLESINE